MGNGSIALHVARIQRRFRFKQQYLRFFFGCRHMLDTVRDDDELAFVKMDILITQLDEQVSFDDEKQLVFNIVVMPDEFAFELNELHVRSVDLTCDPGTPIVLKEIKLLAEIHFFDHASSPLCHRSP